MTSRTICVFTGSRSDFGILRPLLLALRDDPRFELQLLVGGAHLSDRHGRTISEIEQSGYVPAGYVACLQADDSPVGVASAIGLATIRSSTEFARLRPDVLVVLGDRFETLGVVQAALIARIPVAHLHGGERSEGAIDESIRHAISKMAHLHFVAADPFGRRLLAMGEAPERVWVVGAPGLDALAEVPAVEREVLCRDLGIPSDRPFLLLTYHPVTLMADQATPVRTMLQAVETILDETGASVVVTGTNADTDAHTVARFLAEFVDRRDNAVLHPSLGHTRYVQAMRDAEVVVGNSSSGLIEAPAAGTPTVNIGDRQRGRLSGDSVIDVADNDCGAITAAIRRALELRAQPAFLPRSPYGDGHAVPRIVEVLNSVDLDDLLMKRFHDLDSES